MIDLPILLEWKYGCVADTKDNKITAWRHQTLPQPTEEQLARDWQEYLNVVKRSDKINGLFYKTLDFEQKHITGSGPTYVYSFINGPDQQKHDMAVAVRDWIKSIWSLYKMAEYQIKNAQTQEEIETIDVDFSVLPPMPHSVWEF
jgi:hypothetical protein